MIYGGLVPFRIIITRTDAGKGSEGDGVAYEMRLKGKRRKFFV